jgi:hypothetical protein
VRKAEENMTFGKLRQRGMGRVVGGAGPNSEENSFLNKNYIFEYTKALEICTRRFRRNFDMRISPKFF